MILLNQEQLFGQLIPNVFISKITLENIDTPSNTFENPHINLNKKPQLIVNPENGKLVVSTQSLDFSNQNLFEQVSNQKLKVTIDLLLKEKLDNGLAGNWFKNIDFSKYLKLKIFQSVNKKLTESFTVDDELLLSTDVDKFNFLSDDFIKLKNDKLISILSLDNNQSLSNVLDANLKIKTFDVKKDIEGNKSSLNQKYTETDANGNTIISFTYRTSFTLNKQPEHLSFFAFSFLDLNQLTKDFNLTLNSNLVKEPIGKVISEIVFNDSLIVDQSFVYTEENGQIWTGDIFATDDEISGIDKDGNKVKLNKNKVSNSKIQDFRNIEDLKRIVPDFSIINNEILNIKIDNIRNDKLNYKVPDMAFSEMNIAKDEDGNNRFFFALNYKKLLQLNASFGKIFDVKKTSDIALKDSALYSMKVLRRRILGSPEIGSIANSNKLFDSNQTDDVVVLSGEKDFKSFNEINNEKSSLREINQIYFSSSNGNDVRYFTGMDKTVNSLTDGYFIYGIELEIKDPSNDFIFNKASELHEVNNNLKRYYQEAIQLSSNKTIISNASPYIDFPGENKQEQSTLKVGNFDPFLNRFTQKFIEEQQIKYKIGVIDNPKTPWGEAIRIYIDNLKFFVNKENIPFDKYIQSLLILTHPATGTPSGISNLINLIEKLENSILKIIGQAPSFTGGLFSDSSGLPSKIGLTKDSSSLISRNSNKNKIAIKSFKVTKFFNKIFNSNLSKDIGYDFLDISGSVDNKNGLKIISGDEYLSRVERENNHYYIQQNNVKPNINIKFREQIFTSNDSIDNTSFSYLSPARVKLANNFNVMRLGNSPTPSITKDVLALIDFSIKTFNSSIEPLKPNKTENKSIVPKVTQNILHGTIDYFSKLNVQPILINNNSKLVLTDVIKQTLPRIPNNIDPVTKDNTLCETFDSKEVSNLINNTNPAPLLLELTKRLEPVKKTNTLNPNIKITDFSSNQNVNNKINIQTFDIASINSKLNKLIQEPSLHSAESFFQGLSHNTTLDLALSKLPNQIKSLYLARTSPDIVRFNWLNKTTDPLISSEDNTEFRLNYRTLNVVQVFVGYEKSIDEEILLLKPMWIPLTLDFYNQSIGEAIICRMMPYENKTIGIERDKSLELPHFNEYFILRPKQFVVNKSNKNIFNELINKTNIIQMALKPEYITNNAMNKIFKFSGV